jgi:hypothetical protein
MASSNNPAMAISAEEVVGCISVEVIDEQERLAPQVRQQVQQLAAQFFPASTAMPLHEYAARAEFLSHVVQSNGIGREVHVHLATPAAGQPRSRSSSPAPMVLAEVHVSVTTSPTLRAHVGASVDRTGDGGGGVSFQAGNLTGRGDQLTASAGVGATSLRGDYTTSLAYHLPWFGSRAPLHHKAFLTPFSKPSPHFRLSAFRDTRDRTAVSAHHQTHTGFVFEHLRAFPDSPHLRHLFSYSLVDRHLTLSGSPPRR